MELLQQKRFWIFDLDGTLTKPVHDFAHIRDVLGLAPDEDILRAIEEKPDAIKRTMLAQLDRLERHYAALAEPSEGVIPFLARLQNAGCCLGILTRNTKEFAELSLSSIGAERFFKSIDVIGRDEAAPKPSPEGINILLNQWGADKAKSVMVGDFHFDLLSGRLANVTTVHVDASPRHWPEDTDIRVDNLFELSDMLGY